MKYLILIVVLVGMMIMGCVADPAEETDIQEEPQEDTQVCIPNITQECLCLGGANGVQTCSSDGSGWGLCACLDAQNDFLTDTFSDISDDTSVEQDTEDSDPEFSEIVEDPEQEGDTPIYDTVDTTDSLETADTTIADSTDTTESEACVPNCSGLECGPDPVCSHLCGNCLNDMNCENGRCVEESCVSNCTGIVCGPDPVCQNSCGQCPDAQICDSGQCSYSPCVPDCGRHECGLDPVCGEICGACQDGSSCEDGECIVEQCVPNCDGIECGPDPRCGESCGSCPEDEICRDSVCVQDYCGPRGWECEGDILIACDIDSGEIMEINCRDWFASVGDATCEYINGHPMGADCAISEGDPCRVNVGEGDQAIFLFCQGNRSGCLRTGQGYECVADVEACDENTDRTCLENIALINCHVPQPVLIDCGVVGGNCSNGVCIDIPVGSACSVGIMECDPGLTCVGETSTQDGTCE